MRRQNLVVRATKKPAPGRATTSSRAWCGEPRI